MCSKCRRTLKNVDLLDSAITENQVHFIEEIALENSVENIELKTKPLKPAEDFISLTCTQCKKDFATKRQLDKHIDNIHEKKKLSCNFCEYFNSVPVNFFDHIAKHLNPSKKIVKRRGQKCFLQYKDSEIKLFCAICKQDSPSVSDLKTHYEQEHLSKKRMHCDRCGWFCFRKCFLADHIMCKHILQPVRDMYSEKRQFECTYKGCLKRFKTKAFLKQHQDRTHSGKSSRFAIKAGC